MKKVLLSFISIIMIFTTIGTVYAAEVTTGKVTATSAASTVIAGKDITITITAQDASKVNSVSFGQVQVYKSGNTQNTISGISVKNLAPASDDVQRFTEGNTTAFVYMGSNFETSKEMCKIVLSTADNLEEGKYIIRIPDLVVYNKNDDETHIGTKDVEVTIKKDTTTPDNPQQEDPKQEDPKQEDPKQEDPKQEDPKQEDPKQDEKPKDKITKEEKGGSSSSGSGSKSSGSGSSKKLPQTGASQIVVIAIAGLAAFGTVSYILYRKNKIF